MNHFFTPLYPWLYPWLHMSNQRSWFVGMAGSDSGSTWTILLQQEIWAIKICMENIYEGFYLFISCEDSPTDTGAGISIHFVEIQWNVWKLKLLMSVTKQFSLLVFRKLMHSLHVLYISIWMLFTQAFQTTALNCTIKNLADLY